MPLEFRACQGNIEAYPVGPYIPSLLYILVHQARPSILQELDNGFFRETRVPSIITRIMAFLPTLRSY